MAKRRRLNPTPSRSDLPSEVAPETKRYPDGVSSTSARAPIADQAGEAAARAALAEVSGALEAARAEGRLILALPLEAIDATHLVRDRMAAETSGSEGDESMVELEASLKARGQQVPIEVTETAPGRYGLISGWRRLTALRRLAAAGQVPATVLALVRTPSDAAGAYRAMVEENEIREGLSHYERARIVARAVDAGAYPDDRAGLSDLFAAASRPKRSKIGSFLRLVRALDGDLAFPTHLTERQGLALAAALDCDPTLAARLRERVAIRAPASPEAEARVIAEVLVAPKKKPRRAPSVESRPRPGLILQEETGRIMLTGPLLKDEAFRAALLRWLAGEG